jgi:hypothetical protein
MTSSTTAESTRKYSCTTTLGSPAIAGRCDLPSTGLDVLGQCPHGLTDHRRVAHNGVGGAWASGGTGLQRLSDRVAALGERAGNDGSIARLMNSAC